MGQEERPRSGKMPRRRKSEENAALAYQKRESERSFQRESFRQERVMAIIDGISSTVHILAFFPSGWLGCCCSILPRWQGDGHCWQPGRRCRSLSGGRGHQPLRHKGTLETKVLAPERGTDPLAMAERAVGEGTS